MSGDYLVREQLRDEAELRAGLQVDNFLDDVVGVEVGHHRFNVLFDVVPAEAFDERVVCDRDDVVELEHDSASVGVEAVVLHVRSDLFHDAVEALLVRC